MSRLCRLSPVRANKPRTHPLKVKEEIYRYELCVRIEAAGLCTHSRKGRQRLTRLATGISCTRSSTNAILKDSDRHARRPRAGKRHADRFFGGAPQGEVCTSGL